MSARPVVVMKFGGTSVADPEKIARAAERAVRARRAGASVAVVVSAPGEMTDELIALAERVQRSPAPRELDALMATGEQVSIALFAMACGARGVPAVSLTGPQAGFSCAGEHGSSRILRVEPRRVRRELAQGRIVAVAGFQGLNARGDVATLGRGGSDLSAVALAGALRAQRCEIFSDVKGVYTADPRLVPEARKLDRVSYEEMLALAAAGAQVMQARSIEAALRSGVRLQVRSAFHDAAGTWIVPRAEAPSGSVSSLTLLKNGASARLSAVGGALRPGSAESARLLQAFERLGQRPRSVEAASLRVSWTIDARSAESVLRAFHKALGLGRRP
ncbi:MAG TPA: aspartate kinase [Elusimicrobiota bacterium]|nr:aspartate kinase [Elusimicrobiota bacterium]